MKTTLLMVMAVLVMAARPALAVDPLAAEELRGYCQEFTETPDSVLSLKCTAYVSGFLDGAIATDERVAENVVSEMEGEETFSERAFRTRVYGRLRDMGPSVYAEFCVGQPIPVEQVVLHVIDNLAERNDLADLAAHKIVYAALREHYPCE